MLFIRFIAYKLKTKNMLKPEESELSPALDDNSGRQTFRSSLRDATFRPVQFYTRAHVKSWEK